ncbi:MAG: glycerol-3-phosphate 1-O-acyltransferase PlsY [Fuerstiella sp.]|nr:glycerol-3-phosphate 1-O-acyltransferase PlsY [Fuerstiella sp.]
MTILTCSCIGFLVGGIPFGYLAGRLILRDDIRNHGSGNIGATNVARVIGWKWGSLVLLLDALKGLLPTWGAACMAEAYEPVSMQVHIAVATGISAILGHMYPVYLRLRGGKGVATALGVVLILAPKAVLVAVAVFAIVAGTTRLVALGSILAALAFGGVQLTMMGDTALKLQNLSLTIFSIVVPLLIIWRHRGNIVRLVKGTELTVTTPAAEHEESDTDPAGG